jgi:tRNA-dihydrouridine synthase
MNASTTFGEDPAAMARRWLDAGARRLHLVDLNGAFAGKPVNEAAIKAILRRWATEIPVQLGGGIRDLDTIERYLDDGISYVIIGTAAVKNPGFLRTPAAPSAATSSSAWTPRTARWPPTAGASSPATRWSTWPRSSRTTASRRDLHRHRPRRHAHRHQHRRHREAGPGADHPGDRLGRPVRMADIEQAVRGGIRGRRAA